MNNNYRFLSSLLFIFLSTVTFAQEMYWTDRWEGKLYRANLRGENATELSPTTEFPEATALDLNAGKIYWVGNGAIQRANLDGSAVEVVIHSESTISPLGLALDPNQGKIYWSHASSHIHRADLDGSNIETVIAADHIRYLALDLSAGKLYWTESAPSKKIRRSNLDGTQVQQVAAHPFVYNPYGVAVDPVNEKVYWTDAGHPSNPFIRYIKRANVNGSNIETLIAEGFSGSPLSISLDLAAGKMYWAGNGEIRRANLDGSQQEVLLVQGSPNGLSLAPQPAIVGSFPPPCSIDARQPHDLQNATNHFGWNAIDLDFNRDISGIGLDSFSISKIGGNEPIPMVEDILPVLSNRLRLQFAETIEPGAWTCVEFLPAQSKVCLGYLPGDINNDGFANSSDILELINQLNVVHFPYPIWQTDINRSGITGSADILREIDLLNGADAFELWSGTTLPDCP